MMKKYVTPLVALLAAGAIGGLAGVAGWEALDDDPGAAPATSSVQAEPVSSSTTGDTIADVVQSAMPSVVQIQVTANVSGGDEGPQVVPPGEEPDQQQATSTGSGWVFDSEGHVVTNQHVVGDADTATVQFQNGDEAQARVVGTDPSTDVAVLELENAPDNLKALPSGSTDSLRIGDPLIAIGSPFGLSGTVTAGIVSALDRDITAPDNFTIDGAIQTDAALNHGNSGGPLLDGNGRVVGMNAQIASESGGNDGVGYAIPIETVKAIADQLISSGQVEHAYLGVQIGDVENGGGADVGSVVTGGPADDAGLQAGDVIVEANGQKVENADDLRAAVSAAQPGDELKLEVKRGNETTTVTAELADRPNDTN